ncbi:MAG: hypothetical protein V3R80_14905, partial [Candidatus Tectomicrobia bacterium]
MRLFDNYKIKKSVDTLLSLQSPNSSEMTRIITQFQQIGPSVIPKLLDALDHAGKHDNVVTLLVTFVDNQTLPLFLTALSNASPRTAAGILDVLRRADTYDPNRLLGLFASAKLSNAELEKLFLHHQSLLQPDALLRALTTASTDKHAT